MYKDVSTSLGLGWAQTISNLNMVLVHLFCYVHNNEHIICYVHINYILIDS